jgi:hypothetical protein
VRFKTEVNVGRSSAAGANHRFQFQQGQLLEQPQDFEDNDNNDNYSDYVEDISAHADDSYQNRSAVANVYLN